MSQPERSAAASVSGREVSETEMQDREREAADRSAAKLCKCGHKSFNHYHENAPIVEYAQPGVGPCHASVYTTVPMGMNVTRCDCRKFEASDA